MSSIPNWQRRGIGVLSIGGGAIGLSAGLALLIGSYSVVEILVIVVFMLLYAYGIFAGIRLVEGDDRAIFLNIFYWGMQVPAFSSDVLSYVFTGGFHATVWFNFFNDQISGNFLVGSRFNFNLFQASNDSHAGINIFAACVVALLMFYQSKGTPTSGSPFRRPVQ